MATQYSSTHFYGCANAVELRVGGPFPCILCRYTFANIAVSDHASVVGAGTALSPVPASPVDLPIQLFGVHVGVGTANLNLGPVFVCEVKYEPVPTF